MLLKDYYKTLQVSPKATQQEIKKSFRQLAIQYHPDKNGGNYLAEARFREIQEAYEVLSDPKQREQYNYKRWFNRSIHQSFTEQPLTPAAIAEETKRLQAYVDSISIFHVDYEAVSQHIRQLLSDTNRGILQQNCDRGTTQTVIENTLKTAESLPLKYLYPVADLLMQLAGEDQQLSGPVQLYLQKRKNRAAWDKYKWLFIVFIIAFIFVIMYLYGKKN